MRARSCAPATCRRRVRPGAVARTVRTCAALVTCRASRGERSLLEVARIRATSAASGPRRVRIPARAHWPGSAGPRPNRETFALEGDPETAALSDFVALGRTPGRLRARLGAVVRCRSMTLAPIEAARWLGGLGSAAGTNEVVGLAVEES